jgi:hypothetical protein
VARLQAADSDTRLNALIGMYGDLDLGGGNECVPGVSKFQERFQIVKAEDAGQYLLLMGKVLCIPRLTSLEMPWQRLSTC